MGLDQSTAEATLKTVTAEAAILGFRAVVAGADDEHCALPAGAGVGGFLGFTLQDVALGDPAQLHVDGGIALATASAAFAKDDKLYISDATGKVAKVPLGIGGVVIAIALKAAGADGEVVPVLIQRVTREKPTLLAGVGHNNVGAGTLTGAGVGDAVQAVINVTDGTTDSAKFESIITVANQIQQTDAGNLSAKALIVQLIKKL